MSVYNWKNSSVNISLQLKEFYYRFCLLNLLKLLLNSLMGIYIKLTFIAEIPSVYIEDCLAQLFYKELVFVKRNFTADVTADVFWNFQSTFKKIGQESVYSSVASWATLVQREFLEDSKISFSGWYQCMWHSLRQNLECKNFYFYFTEK